MARIITLDWETYYDSKDYTLSKMGPIEYIRDARFTELCLGIRVNKAPTYVVELPDIRQALLDLQLGRPGTFVVGHNMNGFDALILSEIHGIVPWRIMDTMTMMRWTGLSRMMMENHKTLTAHFGHGIKQEGTVVSNGKRYKEDFTPAEWAFFKQYCADDVTQCSENAFKMIAWMSSDAVAFSSMTAKMATCPVLQLDGPMLAGYIQELDDRAQKSMQEISEMFHFHTREEFLKAIRSKVKFCDMLRALGSEPPMKFSEAKTNTMKAKLEADLLIAQQNGWPTCDIQAKLDRPESYTVYEPALAKSDLEFTAMLEDPDPRVALLVQTRLEHNSSIERSRAVRFYELSKSGKPMPVMLKAFHAHTSRYGAGNAEGASDGLNVQNISKRDPQKLTLRRSIKAPAGYKLVSVDSSQIEARMLAFIAGEVELVAQFREGRDPYSELAEKIFSVPWQDIKKGAKSGDKKMKAYRNVGKTAVLSCLAGTSLVLTDTGWKPIISVTENDKLWDGDTWVKHRGLICNGKRSTISLDGLRVTPDHLVYDGSSWRTAEELLNEPSYLKSALSIADESFATLLSNAVHLKHGRSIIASVRSAAQSRGYPNTQHVVYQRNTATTVPPEVAITSSHSHRGILTMNRALALKVRHLLSYVLNGDRAVAGSLLRALYLYSATVERNRAGYYSRTSIQGRRLGVTLARRRKLVARRTKSTGAMSISALTSRIVAACLRVLRRVSNGAVIQATQTISLMADAVSSASSKLVPSSSSTSCLYPAGITPTSTLTALTTTATTSRATCGGRHEYRTWPTDALSLICSSVSMSSKQKLQNYENVYDLRDAGPNHRFMVKTNHGVLLVHNCGYGVGHTKYSNTLLRQGIRLHEDLDQHHEMAKHAHMIYRMSNNAITSFWKQCQRVIEHLAQGGEGYFGGANGEAFHYAMLPVPGGQQAVPSIELLGTGYTLRYPGLRWERNESGKVEYFYDRPRGKNMVKTRIYGGALTENLIQALAFQLLMWQACRMDEQGIPMLANIHDAWLSYAPEDKAEELQKQMEYWMSQVPDWLKGFPVACEGELGDTYEIA